MVPAMSADETTRKAAGRILAWYEAMGVDAALEERPLDWLARGDAAPGALFNVQASRTGSSVAPPTTPRAEMPGGLRGRPMLRPHQPPSRPASSRRGHPPHPRPIQEPISARRARSPSLARC